MKKLWLIFAIMGILSYPLSGFAEGPKFASSTSYKGFFALGLGANYGSARLLNADGTYGSFTGPTYNLSIDVQIFNFGSSEIRAFGIYTMADSTGQELDTDNLKRTESIFGLKLFANPNFFILAGLGNAQQTLTRNSENYSLSHKITAMGLGYDFELSSQWYLGIHGTYKSGPIANANNPVLTQNSFWETGELGLVLTWSPPSTTINFKGK